MKNVEEILKAVGLEIPADKKEEFDKAMAENYKTINEVNGIKKKLTEAETDRDSYKAKYAEDIAQRDGDLENLKKQLAEAGADKTKLEELTNKFSTLQNDYNNAKTEYEKKMVAQKKEFMVRSCVDGLKFTSNSAKKAFLADVIAKDLQVEGDKLLGFDDFVSAYKEQDSGAFVVEDSNEGAKAEPQFMAKSGSGNANGGEPKSEVNSTRSLIW